MATRQINHSDILVLSSSSSPRTDFHRITCHYGDNKSVKIPLMAMTSYVHR